MSEKRIIYNPKNHVFDYKKSTEEQRFNYLVDRRGFDKLFKLYEWEYRDHSLKSDYHGMLFYVEQYYTVLIMKIKKKYCE